MELSIKSEVKRDLLVSIFWVFMVQFSGLVHSVKEKN